MEINDFKRKRAKTNAPILRATIEDAIRNTNSNAQAAKYVGVTEKTYKRYADLYGLYKGHINQRGYGLNKGYSKKGATLDDIFAGKCPNYSLPKLKYRLVARGMLPNECVLCGFSERRLSDKKSPLLLTFYDGDRTNMKLENLRILCYNCMFLTSGTPTVAHYNAIKKSFNTPEKFTKEKKLNVDAIEAENPYTPGGIAVDSEFTEEELAEIRNEALNEIYNKS